MSPSLPPPSSSPASNGALQSTRKELGQALASRLAIAGSILFDTAMLTVWVYSAYWFNGFCKEYLLPTGLDKTMIDLVQFIGAGGSGAVVISLTVRDSFIGVYQNWVSFNLQFSELRLRSSRGGRQP
jgi:hypothetical protein